MNIRTLIIMTGIVLLGTVNSSGQNLVPNPSFEDTISCPWLFGQIDYAPPWFQPTPASSDYLHECSFGVPSNFFGYQNARSGIGYAGVYAYHPLPIGVSYREYIEVKLMDSLESGKNYCIEFYASLSDSSNYSSKMGAYLSVDSIFDNSNANLSYQPQIETSLGELLTDKQGWTLVSGEFIAQGGEQYLTIGNFRDNLSLDTTFVSGGGDTAVYVDYNASYYFIDDISVLICDTTIGYKEIFNESSVTIFPNPSYDTYRISFPNGLIVSGISVYNLLGELVLNVPRLNESSHLPLVFSLSGCNTGIYFINIQTNDVGIIKKVLMKY